MATHALQQGDIPMMCALNDKLLVVSNQGQRACFMEVPNQGGTQARVHPIVDLHRYGGPAANSNQAGANQQSPLVSIHLQAEYIIAVYELTVVIFKQTGELLQEIEPRMLNLPNAKERYRYVKGSVNIAGDNEIILLATNTKESSKTEQSRVLVLREKDSQEQINELLGKG